MRRYIQKIASIVLLISFSGFFIGCWDYDEISDIQIVGGMAIDKNNNTKEYILTFEVLKASVSSKSIKSVIVESKGKTIHAAIRNAVKTTGKTLQMSHAKVVVLSEEVARDGVISVMDLINRDVELRNDMWMLVSDMGTAGEVFTKSKISDEIISYDLANAIENSKKVGKYSQVEAFKLINDISSECVSAMLPLIRVVKQPSGIFFQIGGSAIFNGEKMVGTLDENDTMLLQILNEKGLKFIIPWEVEENKNVSLEIMRIMRKLKTKIEDNKIYVNIKVNMDVDLSELSESGIDFIHKKERDELKRKMEIYLSKSSKIILEKLQKEYKSDVLGIGCYVRNKHPKKWKSIKDNWNDIIQDVKVNVSVNINIKYSGLTNENISSGK